MWLERLRLAKKEALSEEELAQATSFENNLSRQFLSGEISLAEFRQKTNGFSGKGVVLVETLDEFERVLERIGLDEKSIERFKKHEMAHYGFALGNGFKAKLGVGFVKSENRTYFDRALIWFVIPDSLTDDEVVRQALREITLAPGEEMGDEDRDSLP